jgi:hypothetical protein
MSTNIPADYIEVITDLQDQLSQSRINERYLLHAIEAIHGSLCAGQSGTWKQRTEQAVTAAQAIAKRQKGRARP